MLAMKLNYRLVDDFAEKPFYGNPVAVVLDADPLDADQMQRITRWMNLSETVFLMQPTTEEADYKARIFTLNRELPFAGHPTLGSCTAWLSAGNQPADPARIVQECGVGLVPLREINGRAAFCAPPLVRTDTPEDEKLAEVCAFLNIDQEQIEAAQWIDNGPGWLGIRLRSADAVLSVSPAGTHPARLDIGLVGLWPDDHESDVEVRALFSDQLGNVREDPVTGSLNAAVAQWLLASGEIDFPYVATQGRAVGCDGRIYASRDDDGVWISGTTHVVVDGEITLS